MPIPKVVDDLDSVEFVPVQSRPSQVDSPRLRDDILVYTIHDGDQVPSHLWGERSQEVLERPEFRHAFVHERDWGANLVAEHTARRLGLRGYLRINLARMVLDFGRFPGISRGGAPYLTRKALFPPVEDLLDEDQIHQLLGRYYGDISRQVTDHFSSKRITLAVHTYDPFNATGTVRPRISLVSRSLEYQQHSTIPPYVFDPLFPPILCEATSDRALTYQILLDLEKAGHHTALNYPYTMPEGSVEIRAQVWFFFRHLRQAFNTERPETLERPEYQRLWQMLLDVTRRSPESERLRGYLHRYREAPQGAEGLYARARLAYREVRAFLDDNRQHLIMDYRYSPERPSCLGIEVRKDLLSRLDPDTEEVQPQDNADEFAAEIAEVFAGSVLAYADAKNERARQPATARPVLAAHLAGEVEVPS